MRILMMILPSDTCWHVGYNDDRVCLDSAPYYYCCFSQPYYYCCFSQHFYIWLHLALWSLRIHVDRSWHLFPNLFPKLFPNCFPICFPVWNLFPCLEFVSLFGICFPLFSNDDLLFGSRCYRTIATAHLVIDTRMFATPLTKGLWSNATDHLVINTK